MTEKELTFEEETLQIAAEKDINSLFIEEIKSLLRSGAVNREHHNRAVLFAAALHRLADKQTPPYERKELKKLIES